ncbi:hypothetical protein EDE15_2172 [Edaphobacter aggregans]|uniref:Uncharacterized protein n=2 Tax=Edaphobacter aggregans TaxID=570835 RepID=A0A3R9PS26_9BACT|nr:hypothetical protein EDE15_2172 [Edaphobacter aggregans]
MKMRSWLLGSVWRVASSVILLTVIGCNWAEIGYSVPEGPLPPNTILFSQMMRELSATPGFTDAMLAHLNEAQKNGPALMTPRLVSRLKRMMIGRDWQGMNRFPGWTMRALNPTANIANRLVNGRSNGPDGAVEEPAGDKKSLEEAKKWVDVETYPLDKEVTISLDEPSTLPPFSTEDVMTNVGAGVTVRDGADPVRAPMHPESQRLVNVLNRVSLNGVEGSAVATATIGGKNATTPEALIQALMDTGHTVVVHDGRYFANFGHFHFHGQEVIMPFWLNMQMLVPGTVRPLLVPASHAEYEWQVRGPKINADVSWFFGVDGKAEFRTMDSLSQAWVLGRNAHEYRGADAVEVTRLIGRMSVAYAHQHIRRPELPFGGYYPLGVCQDAVAAIEKKMTGKVTLFPITADMSLFDDPRDEEVNALMRATPNDREGGMPEPERVFGSLPTTDFNAVTIPGLAADLVATHNAWENGSLIRTPNWVGKLAAQLISGTVLTMLVVIIALVVRKRRKKRQVTAS